MKTRRLSSDQIELAAHLLKEGHLVAFPTETVYGLGACIFNPDSIARIFEAKTRPFDNPLIAHISDPSDIERIAVEPPDVFFQLAHAFWPGPLTVVLKKRAQVSSLVSAGLETIAVRVPRHPIALHLIQAVGEPLVAPSANLSGRPSSTTADHVLHDLQGSIAAVIDGGACEIGIESTVIALLNNEIVCLRSGAISCSEIESLLKRQVVYATKSTPIASPGMKYRHYAPKAALHLLYSEQQAIEWQQQKRGVCRIIRPTAQTLYSELRQADLDGVDTILAIVEQTEKRDDALLHRLIKAAEVG